MIKYLIFCAPLFASCAHIVYDGKSDGSTYVSIYTIGSDKLIKDFKGSISKSGDRKVSIGSLDTNQTKGMKQANQGLKMLMEGLSQGAVEGMK